MPDPSQLLSYDRDHLWHPYSSVTDPAPLRLVESASGIRLRLRDADGTRREVIDGMSSWWCAIHGYAVPELDAAAQQQLGRMSHVMFGGLTHEPAITLARKLIERAPACEGQARLEHVFLADSGSVSVEVALKMAWQAHLGSGRPRRTMFTIRGGYHGDTLAPMSVCDPVGGMHRLFTGVLPEQIFAPLPPAGLDGDDPAYDEWETATRQLYAEHAPDIAAVVLEPVLQGAGGMRVYPPRAVRFLAALAREHGALVIFDEIATGFGRLGTMWAADQVGVVPDILCVGKALTGGYLTLAAVLCTSDVARAVSGGEAGALMHGPTFMGNPLACAIASASMDLVTPTRIGRARQIEAELRGALEPARSLSSVRDVRLIGAVGVIQLNSPVDTEAVTRVALDHGVWLRPFRDLVYTMPPLVSDADAIETIGGAMVTAVEQVHG